MTFRLLLLLIATFASCSGSLQLSATTALLDRAFHATTYADRCMLGRKAQLGGGDGDEDEMRVYRPGLIGGGGGGAVIDGSRTYGEYDLEFFATLVGRALDGMEQQQQQPYHFVDIGSGVGRLTLAAAHLWPTRLRRSSGVEVVGSLHEVAVEASARVAGELSVPCDFVLADAEAALAHDGPLASADLCFAYSSAFAGEGDVLTDFSRICGSCLRVGTRVITTDRRLLSVEGLWGFELLERLEGSNRETGGQGAVGFIQEVTHSRRGS